MMYRNIAAALLTIVITGCSAVAPLIPPGETPAYTTKETSSQTALDSLPSPAGRIPVTVYAFRDQTGQYKPQANVSSFSTAVTQGAASILMQILSDSTWFMPVEREGLQNILTERKIIRAALQANNDNAQESAELPPLTTAKIILEGGIISYDSNTTTGGFGAEYFGLGASELYREDQISVYLRAVDVRTGQVLVSVSSSKKVLSQEVRAGLFRYVSYQRLLELETGYTTNEPMHICVRQAIELAIADLVQKGIDIKVWRAS